MNDIILNVDDNEAARYSSSRTLRRAGYEVVEAGTATDALRIAEERKPRLVILDINLPDLSGFDVCRRLKSEPLFASTLVLQTSATHLDNEARIQSLDAGADGYLIQPADPDVLLATVRSLLRISQAEAALRTAAEENKQLLAREQAARAQAEAASHAKDDFLATMSHELRSPINAILLWTNMLTSSSLDANATARAIASIDRSARLQARLIDDLLDISRIVAGKLSIIRVELSLKSAIEAAVENIRNDAKTKNVSIETDLTTEAAVVDGDPARLQQVFSNLLSNAVKFSSSGGRITISMRCEADRVTVQVVDRGQGISAAFLPHVFEQFRQADSSTTRSHGGLGLGLAIVSNLVLMHGGEVAAESAGEGHGSTFTVRLPRHRGTAVTHDRALEVDTPELFAGCHVLLVDDDEEFRSALSAQLRGWGATVTMAASAREGFELFEQIRPNLVLSDIGMPNEDGYALIRWIRALPPERGGDVKAAALTAYAMPHERSPVLDAGYQLHVGKPVDPSSLRTALLQLLDPGECRKDGNR